jgi:hypothetical protein
MSQVQTIEGLSMAQLAQTSDAPMVKRSTALMVGGAAVGLVAFLQYRWWVKGGAASCSQKCVQLTTRGGY